MKNIRKIALLIGVALMLACLSFALISCGECEHVYGEWIANGDATCEGQNEIRTCNSCGVTETRFNTDAASLDAHAWGEWTAVGSATCEGQDESRTCSTCNTTENRKNTEGVSGTHSYSDWAATGKAYCEGVEEARTCSVCSNVETRYTGEAVDHTWGSWRVTVIADCTKNGQKTRTCSTCERTETETTEKTGHKGLTECTVCGTTLIETPPVIEAPEFDSVGFYLTDLEITIDEEYDLSSNGVCTLNVAEGYVTLDENGKLYGYGHGVLDAVADETDITKQVNCAFYIEDDWLYAYTSGDLDITSTGTDASQYMKLSLVGNTDTAEIEGALGEAEALMPDIENWFNNSFAPEFDDVNIDGAVNAVDALFSKLAGALISVTTNSDGSYDLSINYGFYKDVNDALGRKTISELVDIIIKEGAFAEIEELITSEAIYEYSVADLLNYIQVDQGVDLEALLDAIDELLVIVSGQEGVTLEMLISESTGEELPEGFDIYTMLTDEELSGLTVMEALLVSLGAPEDDPSTTVNERAEAEAQLKEMVITIIDMAKESTFYQLAMSNSDDEISNEDIEEMMEMIDAQIDELMDSYSYVMSFDSTGAFKGLSCQYTYMVTQDVELTISIVADKDFNYTYTITSDIVNLTFEMIPGETVEIDTSAVATIKENVNKVPTLTNDDILSLLEEKYFGADIVYNSAENCYYVYGYNYYNNSYDSYYGYTYYVYYDVYKISTDVSSTAYKSGCNGIDIYNVGLNADYGTYVQYEVSSSYSLSEDEILALVDYDALLSNADLSSTTIDLYFKNVSGNYKYFDIWYDGGHYYQLDSSKSTTSDVCLDICYRYYTCSKCGDSYIEYYTNSHSFNSGYRLIGETVNDGYEYYKSCSDCGHEEIEFTVGIESDYDLEYYSGSSYYASFTYYATSSGYYTIYSKSDAEYCDTWVSVSELDDYGYKSTIDSNDDGGMNGHFKLEVYLEAGCTYIFDIRNYSNESFTVVFE